MSKPKKRYDDEEVAYLDARFTGHEVCFKKEEENEEVNEEVNILAEDLTDATFFIIRNRLSFQSNEQNDYLNVLDSLCAARQYILNTNKRIHA